MKFEYYDLLNDYIFSIWKFLLIPIAVFVLILVADLIKRKGKITLNGKISKIFIIDMFLIVGVIVIGLVHTVPVKMDINENAIEKVSFETAYFYNQSYLNDDALLGINPILFELEDGTKLELGDPTFDFPYEVENGTVVYAKHSRIILDYSGTIIHNDKF